MANKKLAYNDVTTINDLKKDLLEHPEYSERSIIMDETLKLAVTALDNMDKGQEKAFIKSLHNIDKDLSLACAANANRFHKVPTILASAIFFAYYPSQIADLTDDEIALLSKYSALEQPSYFENARSIWSKEMLSAITSLSKDFMEQQTYMFYVEQQFDGGKSNEEMLKTIAETPREKLLKQAIAYEQKAIEEGGYLL